MAVTKIIDPTIIDSVISQGNCVLLWTEKSGADVIKLADTLFEDASARFPEIQFYAIDADMHVTLAESYGVRATPACLVFEDGGFISEHIGPFSYDELNALLMNWHDSQLIVDARAKSEPKQKPLWYLIADLARIEPNEQQAGDVFLDTQRFYDGLFAVIGHPDANAKTLRGVEFKIIFQSFMAVASEVVASNYKSKFQYLNVLDSVVLNNSALILLRLNTIAPSVLLKLLNIYNENKAAGKIINALNRHSEILNTSVASMINEYAPSRNTWVHFTLPKSGSAIPCDTSRHYLDIFADYVAVYISIPTLTLKSLALVAAYMQNGLSDDLANDAKVAVLFKRAIKSPTEMVKAVLWVLERANAKADEFKVKTEFVDSGQTYSTPLMSKQDEAFDLLRQTLDYCHMDYSMLNATTGHFEMGYSTTEYHFSRYSKVLNECISGLRNGLQQKSPEFSQIQSVGIVLRHIDILQTAAFAKAFRKLPTYKADLKVIRETPAICFSANILANNSPAQYEVVRAGIEFRPVGKSAKQSLPTIKMLPYDEQLLRIAETLCSFSDVLHQIAQLLKDNNEQALNLADFLVDNLEMISAAIENIRLAVTLSGNKATAEVVGSCVDKSIVSLRSIKQLILFGRWTDTRLPNLPRVGF